MHRRLLAPLLGSRVARDLVPPTHRKAHRQASPAQSGSPLSLQDGRALPRRFSANLGRKAGRPSSVALSKPETSSNPREARAARGSEKIYLAPRRGLCAPAGHLLAPSPLFARRLHPSSGRRARRGPSARDWQSVLRARSRDYRESRDRVGMLKGPDAAAGRGFDRRAACRNSQVQPR